MIGSRWVAGAQRVDTPQFSLEMGAAGQLDGWHRVAQARSVPVQDDSREQQMVALFNLTVPADRGRSDVDAYLKLPELEALLPFELKSTTSNSVSTVRDFGPEHIAKWRDLHWIFAFYESGGATLRHCYYASPADMGIWIADKQAYIRPDMVLASESGRLLSDATVTQVLGTAEVFSTVDARLIMKNQWSAASYRTNADIEGSQYSRGRMVELLRERLAYVIRRGATLNNPHIPEGYLLGRGLQQITEDHAATLRKLVRDYLAEDHTDNEADPIVEAQARAAESETPTA